MKKELWMRIRQDIIFEWRQCMDEGHDVAHLENECELIHKMEDYDPNKQELAESMYNQLVSAPVRQGYGYNEPSDLEGIKRLRPGNPPVLPDKPDETVLYDKLYGAWIGRVCGCILGKPVEGWYRDQIHEFLKETGQFPLSNYIFLGDSQEVIKKYNADKRKGSFLDNFQDCAPADDDTNYTVLGLKLLEERGSGFSQNDVASMWLRNLPMLATCTAERVAYRNIAGSIFPPESATYKNPFREWIGAQIRGDIFGYVNPGHPELASEYAWRDSSISHTKNGIYGEMFVAAMLAAVGVCDDVRMIIEAGLGQIPHGCRLAEKVHEVIHWHEQGIDAQAAVKKIHQMYNEKDAHHWCHTISNAMIVVTGLLYGQKDFGKSIIIAVDAAFDTDCNGATVGSVVGMIVGAKGIPQQWTQPFNDTLATDIAGYNNIKISELAKRTMEIIDNAR